MQNSAELTSIHNKYEETNEFKKDERQQEDDNMEGNEERRGDIEAPCSAFTQNCCASNIVEKRTRNH